jgi:hypothetical protein
MGAKTMADVLVKRSYDIKGVLPCLMHNGQLADPLNKFSKEIKKLTGLRKRTDAQIWEIARLEFLGGLYCNSHGPYWPAENIKTMLKNAAKRVKLGTTVDSAVLVEGDCPLIYNGPKDPDELWEKQWYLRTGCGNKGNTIIRTRPKFDNWAIKFTTLIRTSLLNVEQMDEIVEISTMEGLSDWRPRYGRFVVTAIDGKSIE